MKGSFVSHSSVSESEKPATQVLPSGTLTFLFTDIESSTHLWEQFPEQMQFAMKRHDVLIESAVVQQGGVVVRPRGEGDSRFAVFSSAKNALLTAVAIQRLLLAEPWTISSLKVRIALHSGEADRRDGDYYGSAVNRCARLRSAAHGGQILVSETTYCLVRDDLPASISLRDLGEHNLKDLGRPEHIYQPVVADLPSDFPPVNTLDKTKSNLPLSLTSFIGREREMEEIEKLLLQTRFLTLSGPGGAGKTRLATQVVQNLYGFFPDGIWFIDLAPLSKTTLLSQYVINELGMREDAGRSPNEILLDNLRDKTLLMILDNCEHLLPDVAHLAEAMLRNAPNIRILATSREKLGVASEIIWRIPSLSSPDGVPLNIECLMEYESVRLFLDRAKAAKSDFTISVDNAGIIAQICARLDGIPLAIELAAARVRVLSVEEISKRLNDRFHLLVGSQIALPRQQTLHALVDWSYDLLTEKERMLLRRLSVFSGGWTLEATEHVCSGRGIQDWEVLDLLTNLIDKSFVNVDICKCRERYRFLETIHKFSQERLSESNEAEEFAQKHAAYFLEKTVDSYGKEWGPEQGRWLEWLDEENDNLRAVLVRLSQVAGNEEALLKLSGSLWKYWEIRGYLSEGRAWLDTALLKNVGGPDYWRANGLGGAGHLARQQGDFEQAKKLHERSLEIFRALGDRLGAARQLNALGEIARYVGDYDRSIELHKESLSLRYEIDDKEGIAVSLRQLGVIARDRGQYQNARMLLEESLKLELELGDKIFVALALNDLGLVAESLCEFEKAISLFQEAMSMQLDLKDKLGISNSLQNLGNAAKDQGDFKKADLLYKECLTQKKELGDKRGISGVIAALGEIAFRQGKYSLAAELVGQSLTVSKELGLKRGVLNSLGLLGFIAFYQGDYKRAAALADEAFTLATKIDAPRAIGYTQILRALGKYSEGNLEAAREKFQEALAIFAKINDRRSIALTYVNLARTAYRQGESGAAMRYLDLSLAISGKLNIRWTHGFVLEIMGLVQRSFGNYERALELFQESLHLSVEQENQQGIANCLGALAGLAVMAGEPRRAARLFAAAARLRREMGAKMSSNDRHEYEQYLDLVHEKLDHAAFEVEWSEGFSMTTEQIIKDLKEWSVNFSHDSLPQPTEMHEINVTAFMGGWHSLGYVLM